MSQAESQSEQDYLQSFLQRAQAALAQPNKASGTFAKLRLDTGFMVYGLGTDSKFFDGGTTDSENSVAFDAAKSYAKENKVEKNVVFAMQLTIFGGTQYPEPKVYNTDDGNLNRVVMNFSSQHPVTQEWSNPGVTWQQMAKSFEGDYPVTTSMIGKEFWGHVATVPHPYFDKDNADTHVKYVVQWDKDDGSPRLNDEGEVAPEFLQYVKAAFNSRDDLVAYAYELGVTEDGGSESSDVPAAVGAWVGSESAWRESWPKVSQLLQKVAESSGKPEPIVNKLYDELKNDWALTREEVDAYVAQLPPF